VAFEAVWFGDGELLPAMKARAEAAGLSGSVRFPGSVPRTEVMTAVRDADMFLFCHQTEESPRCLVEAIASGSPIVGYSSQYARDLVDTGETFVERGDVRTLAERLARLDADRGAMARLARAALQSSLRLDRDAAIFERVRLVKEFMPLGQSGEPAGRLLAKSDDVCNMRGGSLPPCDIGRCRRQPLARHGCSCSRANDFRTEGEEHQ